MKAFLLAAGLGTRLKPLTNSTPKCLVEIHKRPLLAWWIELFESHGIDEVLINLHHLSNKVVNFIESYKSKIRFKYFFENELIGSGGTLRENKEFVRNEKSFFICYADNLTNYNLSNFNSFHQQKKNMFSMALFQTDSPTTKGIVSLNDDSTIINFEEKPSNPKSNLANAGIYISSPEILELIPNQRVTDIGYHLLPKLVGKMTGWECNDYLIDIGSHADLKKAELDWKNIIEGKINK